MEIYNKFTKKELDIIDTAWIEGRLYSLAIKKPLPSTAFRKMLQKCLVIKNKK